MAKPHISYNDFKQRFGNLGVTKWTKYNWLDNGLGYRKVVLSDLNWFEEKRTRDGVDVYTIRDALSWRVIKNDSFPISYAYSPNTDIKTTQAWYYAVPYAFSLYAPLPDVELTPAVYIAFPEGTGLEVIRNWLKGKYIFIEADS